MSELTLRVHPHRTTRITEDEARESLKRFVNRHFDNAGDKSRTSIPTHQDDDDIRLNDYITQMEAALVAAQEEIASALSLINKHLTGRKYVSLDDAIRQVIQAYITTDGSCKVVEEENRKLREQDRRNEVTMGELTRTVAADQAYILRLRIALERIAEGRGPFSRDQLTFAQNVIEECKRIANEALAPPPAEVIYRDGTVEQVEPQKDGEK